MPLRARLIGLILVAVSTACGTTPTGAPAADGGQTTDSALADAPTDAGTSTGTDTASAVDADAAPSVDAKPETTKPVCNPYTNTGCTEPNTHCGYDDTDTVACVANGSHGIGEDCEDGAGCLAGTCIQSQNGESRCAPYCASDVQCDSDSCNKVEGKKWKVCDVAQYTPCNPIAQDCADKTLGCYKSPNGVVCLKKGTAEEGETCSSSNDCLPGLDCAGASGSGTGLCRPVCSIDKTTPCDPVTIPCSQFYPGSKYGYCDG